ncbi:hypothetical protein DFJ58DRAFT_730562 [Suillus subalutaceus]|uniref:uncharacterized protein n=1 Tax=Suillus subalutaceus TaxID=48586 RepID=UPI001B85E9BA|nr:uncharacterized protein DFJ58DRAFT_730562 [Suillus subalutaceus]KAG1846423.1 hypothetical protein DFJ58DRAFT_730562 [Suillus subalutaceus]
MSVRQHANLRACITVVASSVADSEEGLDFPAFDLIDAPLPQPYTRHPPCAPPQTPSHLVIYSLSPYSILARWRLALEAGG